MPRTRTPRFVLAVATGLACIGVAEAQVIDTVAGGGPDNVPALSANLAQPVSVAVDGSGNLFLAARELHRVFKVDGSGQLTVVAGSGTPGFSGDGGPATATGLSFPSGVALDAAGNLFIADRDSQRIRRVDAATGIVTTVAGNGSVGFSGDGGPATTTSLFFPSGVALDTAGNLFIADQSNQRIRRVDGATGIITTVAGNGGFGFSGDGGSATATSLFFPSGVAVDAAGNLLIADTNNARIRRVDGATGIISTVAGNGAFGFIGDGGPATAASLNFPSRVALDAAGNLLIADTSNHRIRRVDGATGIITTVAGSGFANRFSGDGGPATGASLNAPSGVALDAAGNLFLSDRNNQRIRRVDAASGIITTVAGNGIAGFGGDGGPATSASLNAPSGVALDAAGNLLIVDTNNARIRRVDAATGIITTVAGNGGFGFSGDDGPATSASLNAPSGVALDAAGNLLIADTNNARIRRVDAASGIITTVAGNGIAGFGGDGGPATSASLDAPSGVALDAADNLLIADQSNQRIRRVDGATGMITTIAGNGIAGFGGDGGPATGAGLSFPSGVVLDAAGNLFLSDRNNQRIRRVDAASGIITTVAGNGIAGFSGDGGLATATSLSFPTGVALDAAGNLFIADQSNQRIRRVASECTACRVDFGPVATLNAGAGIDSLSDTTPDVATDGAGNWVAVWDVAAAFGTGEDILVARSTDAGQTWTAPAVIADSGALHDAARLATGGSGTWIAVWHSNDDRGGTLGTDWDIFYSRSTDAGLTWTAPAALHSDFGADGGARDVRPTLATDGDGTWVVAWETCAASTCSINNDMDILFSRSGNDGTTWSKPAFLNSDAAGDAPKSDSRPSLATDGSGTWVAMWQPLMARSTNGGRGWSTVTAAVVSGPPHVVTDGVGTWLAVGTTVVGSDIVIAVSRSTDAGVSWTPAAALHTNSGDDSSPQLATDGTGNWLATWTSTEGLSGALGTDFDVLSASSTDTGVTWTAPEALDANAFSDVGFDFGPRLATDALGNWVVVWYSDDDRGGTIGTDFDVLFSTGIGPDQDGDGLTDGAEVNVHGTDPLLADTDGDGLDDGVEVNVIGTSPLLPDHDSDGICDGGGTGGGACTAGPDNCPFVSNSGQANSDAFSAGDACQCGDLNNDGVVNGADALLASQHVVGRTIANPSFDLTRCNVIGPSDGGVTDCNVADAYVLDRFTDGFPVTVENTCQAYTGP